jgi:hypothetical protein
MLLEIHMGAGNKRKKIGKQRKADIFLGHVWDLPLKYISKGEDSTERQVIYERPICRRTKKELAKPAINSRLKSITL